MKKLEFFTMNFSQTAIRAVFLFVMGVFSIGNSSAQSAELKQKVAAFKTDFEENYEMNYLNISDRDLGYIEETDPAYKEEFQLKAKEKTENNIGNRSKAKFYFSVFAYETLDDRQWALKDWMEDFIEGKTLRKGRTVRTYEYATPTIILINDLEIIVVNYDCKDYSEDNFEKWNDELLRYFGNENTMVIEILCDGPLEWTKNAPDPKDRAKLF